MRQMWSMTRLHQNVPPWNQSPAILGISCLSAWLGAVGGPQNDEGHPNFLQGGTLHAHAHAHSEV